MKNTVVSERYARALFELSQENNSTDKVQEDLKLISNTIKEYIDLKNFLSHPVISIEDKKDTCVKIFSGKISKYTNNILMLLLDKKREIIIPEVAELYQEMYNKLHNRVIADVYTSVEIGSAQLVLLRKKLESYLDKQVEIDTHVDENVIGGVLVKIGDRVIDGTLKTRFENMAKTLR